MADAEKEAVKLSTGVEAAEREEVRELFEALNLLSKAENNLSPLTAEKQLTVAKANAIEHIKRAGWMVLKARRHNPGLIRLCRKLNARLSSLAHWKNNKFVRLERNEAASILHITENLDMYLSGFYQSLGSVLSELDKGNVNWVRDMLPAFEKRLFKLINAVRDVFTLEKELSELGTA